MHDYISLRKSTPDNACMHENELPDARAIVRQLMESRQHRSERELAIAAGIEQSAFNRWMRGETESLSTPTLQALARHFGVTSSQLLGEVPLEKDPRISAVVLAMEKMPDYLKDAVLAAATSLVRRLDDGPG